jgi:diguanylate cyclase (GGDEF)-like protein
MGIAAYPSHGKNSGEVLRSADSALYQAKSEGRDRVVVSAGARDPD